MIYLVLVPTILFLPLLTDKFKNGKKFYFAVITVLLMMFAGLRHWSVGVDTATYVNKFLSGTSLKELSWSELSEQSEFLHIIYRTAVHSVTENYMWYLLPVSVFYIGVTSRFIYKYSAYPSISFLAFLSMSYYAFSMTGIRQTICYGFLILATDALIERKRLLSLIFIIISAGFHTTGWLFLSVFVIDALPFGFAYLGGIVVICAVAFLRAPVFIRFFLQLLDKSEGYLDMETGSTIILMVIVIVSIAAILLHPDIFKKTKSEIGAKGKLVRTETQIDQFFIKMVLFSIPILIISLVQANIFRIAAMFHIYMIILIPGVIKKQRDPYIQALGKLIVFAALLAELFIFTYNAAEIFPYSFSI